MDILLGAIGMTSSRLQLMDMPFPVIGDPFGLLIPYPSVANNLTATSQPFTLEVNSCLALNETYTHFPINAGVDWSHGFLDRHDTGDLHLQPLVTKLGTQMETFRNFE